MVRLCGTLFVLLDSEEMCFRFSSAEEPSTTCATLGEYEKTPRESPGRIIGKIDSRSIVGVLLWRELRTMTRARPEEYMTTAKFQHLSNKKSIKLRTEDRNNPTCDEDV